MDHLEHRHVLATLDRYLKAIHDRDADAAMDVFTPDAITHDFAPPLLNDTALLHEPVALIAWFDGWSGPITTEQRKPTVWIAGDLAVIHGLQRLRGRKVTGPPVDMWYRATVVLRRVDGEWRIAHLHNSVPMAMDHTGRALTDLKP